MPSVATVTDTATCRERGSDASASMTSTVVVPAVAAGRQPIPRPKTRPLKPPQRYRPVPRWKSTVVLLVVAFFITLSCMGAVGLGQLGMQMFHASGKPVLPATTPTPTPLATLTATPGK